MTTLELERMTIAELRSLNEKVVAVIKAKRSVMAEDVKQQLYVGANVAVNHPKLKGLQCVITKVNYTKAVIDVLNSDRHGSYNVPLSMIELVK